MIASTPGAGNGTKRIDVVTGSAYFVTGLICLALVLGVVAVGVVLMVTAGPDDPIGGRGRTDAEAEIEAFRTALTNYRRHHGRFPTTAEGLAVLAEPTDRMPRGFLERRCEYDPWGNPYEYISDGEAFLIVSYGSDGIEGGDGSAADVRGGSHG